MSNIPVLYYHSVADHEEENNWSFLSCPIGIFKKQMEYLYKNGYYTCDWNELKQHLEGTKKLPKKTVKIHFDDGFLDNWTVVHPIMKSYGLKYSVVVTPEFIQPKGVREFTDTTTLEGIEKWWGYLSKEEMKKMSDSGLVDFQAHGYTHTWYPISDEIIDIKDKTNFYPHLLWNTNKERKPFWLTDKGLSVPLGYPVFKYEKSLANGSRFIPNPKFIEDCLILQSDTGFDKQEILKKVLTLREQYLREGNLGRYETQTEYQQRMEKELYQTRMKIEEIIDIPVEYLVYPGGGNTEKVNQFARKYGYRLVTKGNELNTYRSDIFNISRMSGFHDFKSSRFNQVLNQLFFWIQIKRGQGHFIISSAINSLKKLKKLLKI